MGSAVYSNSAVQKVTFFHDAPRPQHRQTPDDAVSTYDRSWSHDGVSDYGSLPYLGPVKDDAALYYRPLCHRTSLSQSSTTTDCGSSPYLASSRYGHRR